MQLNFWGSITSLARRMFSVVLVCLSVYLCLLATLFKVVSVDCDEIVRRDLGW